MDIAVRYCSLHGNTKAIAEEIADELGVQAISISDEPELKERADVLFLGGAPYWSVMDPALEEYARKLSPVRVGTVVLFTTSNWSRRTAIGLREILENKGIVVAPGHFYAHMTQIEKRKSAARRFAREAMERIQAKKAVKNTGFLPELKTEAVTVGAMITGVIAITVIIPWVFRKKAEMCKSAVRSGGKHETLCADRKFQKESVRGFGFQESDG